MLLALFLGPIEWKWKRGRHYLLAASHLSNQLLYVLSTCEWVFTSMILHDTFVHMSMHICHIYHMCRVLSTITLLNLIVTIIFKSVIVVSQSQMWNVSRNVHTFTLDLHILKMIWKNVDMMWKSVYIVGCQTIKAQFKT